MNNNKNKHSNKTKNNKLKEVILLFTIPIIIILLVIGLSVIPQLIAKPSTNFIYCKGYNCEQAFEVNNAGIISSKLNNKETPDLYNWQSERASNANTLYLYDVSLDSYKPISLEEAKTYKIDPSSKSPQGYSFVEADSSGGFLFYSNGERGWILKKDFAYKRLEIDSYDIQFIGWVK